MVKAISAFKTVPAQYVKRNFANQATSKLPILEKPLLQYSASDDRNRVAAQILNFLKEKKIDLPNIIKWDLKNGGFMEYTKTDLKVKLNIAKSNGKITEEEHQTYMNKIAFTGKNNTTPDIEIFPEAEETVGRTIVFTSQPVKDIDVSLPESLQEIVDSDTSIELLDSKLEGLVDDLADSLSDGENVQEIFNKIIDAT